ncbi:unnamed protein product [Ectocarpus sp. 6 AP-2014]
MVWVSLLVCITAYTIWQIWKVCDDLANPSTSLKITNDLYAYPHVLVCFFHAEGCGFEDESVDMCVTSASEYSSVSFNGEVYDDLGTISEFTNCVGFDLGSLELGDDITEENDNAIIDTIGKTTKKKLNGDVTTTFPPLVLSSSDYTAENTLTTSEDDILQDPSFGRLYLDIQQGSYSRTAIAEVDPLDIGTFLGNIGGFWELLLILWGLFFITTREERGPKMKARDFAKTARTTKELVTRRRSLSVDSAAASATSAVEQRPQWEAAFRGDTAAVPQFGGGNTAVPTVPPANDGGASNATRRASNDSSGIGSTSSALFRRATGGMPDPQSSSSGFNFKRPVVRDMPRRGSRTGGSLPEAQPRAPPSYDEMSAK